jgi:hypothetical protein
MSDPRHPGAVRRWIARPQARRVTLAIEHAFSDGGRYRSGDLIQCGPALTERNLTALSTFIPGTMFQGVQPIQ